MLRTLNAALLVLLALVSTARADLIYSSNGFEQPTFVPGPINGQNGWTGNGDIQTSVKFSGDQALRLFANGFQGANFNTNIPFTAPIRAEVDFLFHTDNGISQAGLSLSSNQGFVGQIANFGASNASASSIFSPFLAGDVWHHLALEVNPTNQTITGFVNGNAVATFPIDTPGPIGAITSVQLYTFGGSAGDNQVVFFDNLQITQTPEPASIVAWFFLSVSGLVGWWRWRSKTVAPFMRRSLCQAF
jgi:hypothetical protein